MVYMTYNISYKAIQAKHRPLTPNIIQTAPFFTHPYTFTPHTECPRYHSRSKITYEDDIHAEIQKIFNSPTDKWYISLIIYLNMHFKLNIDL